jgi:hypothetical protein
MKTETQWSKYYSYGRDYISKNILVNGLYHGPQKTWYASGRKCYQSNCINGRIIGIKQQWNIYNNSRWYISTFKNNELFGFRIEFNYGN